MTNNIFTINEFYCCIIEIQNMPFVVFSITENFEEGLINIYTLYQESMITAYQDFKELHNDLNNLHNLIN
mgnify:CR=1 FL=1